MRYQAQMERIEPQDVSEPCQITRLKRRRNVSNLGFAVRTPEGQLCASSVAMTEKLAWHRRGRRSDEAIQEALKDGFRCVRVVIKEADGG